MISLQAGDILLLPKEKAIGAYTYIEDNISKSVADFLAFLTQHNYIHSEVYLGRGFVMAAWFNGVKLFRPTLDYFDKFHIYRHKNAKPQDFENVDIIKKFFNKEYDFQSLIENGIVEALSFSIKSLEENLENFFGNDTPNKLICSELVARYYREAGYPINDKDEFVSPDDIAQNPLIDRIL